MDPGAGRDAQDATSIADFQYLRYIPFRLAQREKSRNISQKLRFMVLQGKILPRLVLDKRDK